MDRYYVMMLFLVGGFSWKVGEGLGGAFVCWTRTPQAKCMVLGHDREFFESSTVGPVDCCMREGCNWFRKVGVET